MQKRNYVWFFNAQLLSRIIIHFCHYEEGKHMEVTAVAQLRRMVLEHLSRYTWNFVLIDRVYYIL